MIQDRRNAPMVGGKVRPVRGGSVNGRCPWVDSGHATRNRARKPVPRASADFCRGCGLPLRELCDSDSCDTCDSSPPFCLLCRKSRRCRSRKPYRLALPSDQIRQAHGVTTSADFLILRNRFSGPGHQADKGPSRIGESIMLGFQPFKGAPVHPLGLAALRVRYPGFPSKPPPDVVCPPHRSIIICFPLALIGQLVTVPTGED